jgi:hypothetical protein
MGRLGACLGGLVTVAALAAAADEPARLYEMRVYVAAEGKLEALQSRFRDHTCDLFARHGMTNVGYFVPEGSNPGRRLVYFLSYPDRASREASWKAFLADPEWKRAYAESERDGTLVERIESHFLVATDYSPAFPPGGAAGGLLGSPRDNTAPPKPGRVFELRTYTATPGSLPALNARFRDHTCGLFSRHGMTNVVYWNLAEGETRADRMLIYLLAHESREAAGRSFAAFRQDPDWIAARTESERRVGGSLTEADRGVVSEFLVPTDYSPLK